MATIYFDGENSRQIVDNILLPFFDVFYNDNIYIIGVVISIYVYLLQKREASFIKMKYHTDGLLK